LTRRDPPRCSRRAARGLPGGFLSKLNAPLKYKLGRRRDDAASVGRRRSLVLIDGSDDARHKGFVRAVRPQDVALVVPRRLDEPPLGVGRGPPVALPREQHHLPPPTRDHHRGLTLVSPFEKKRSQGSKHPENNTARSAASAHTASVSDGGGTTRMTSWPLISGCFHPISSIRTTGWLTDPPMPRCCVRMLKKGHYIGRSTAFAPVSFSRKQNARFKGKSFSAKAIVKPLLRASSSNRSPPSTCLCPVTFGRAAPSSPKSPPRRSRRPPWPPCRTHRPRASPRARPR